MFLNRALIFALVAAAIGAVLRWFGYVGPEAMAGSAAAGFAASILDILLLNPVLNWVGKAFAAVFGVAAAAVLAECVTSSVGLPGVGAVGVLAVAIIGGTSWLVWKINRVVRDAI